MTHSITCYPDDTRCGTVSVEIRRDPDRLVMDLPVLACVWDIPSDGFRLDELIQISYFSRVSILWLAHQLTRPEYGDVAGSVAATLAQAFRDGP